jgi:hypothetical protein
VIQLAGAESSWVDRELAKTANICAVVYHIIGCLRFGSVGKRLYDIFEGSIEGFYKVKGLIQESVCEFAIV